jgi:hypothetical protein
MHWEKQWSTLSVSKGDGFARPASFDALRMLSQQVIE